MCRLSAVDAPIGRATHSVLACKMIFVPVCITHDEKLGLSAAGKEIELLERVARIKKRFSKSPYHCVVPVIGDAEDYYVVSKVLELGLNPLIVSVNDYFKNDIGWHNLQNLITHFDVDSFIFNLK